jgi:hypothetical protein
MLPEESPKSIAELNLWIEAYEKVIKDFEDLIQKVDSSDEYSEERLHKLNSKLAHLLCQRADFIEDKLDAPEKATYPTY